MCWQKCFMTDCPLMGTGKKCKMSRYGNFYICRVEVQDGSLTWENTKYQAVFENNRYDRGMQEVRAWVGLWECNGQSIMWKST